MINDRYYILNQKIYVYEEEFVLYIIVNLEIFITHTTNSLKELTDNVCNNITS